MPRLTDAQIAAAVKEAGFPAPTQTTAVAIALAESGGNSDATHRNTNGSTDYGLFQINSIHAALLNEHTWNDPVDNAKMALVISSNGSNWRPWVTYTTARYAPYLPRAKRAIGDSTGVTAPNTPSVTPVGFTDTTGNFFSFISSGNTWKRFGFIVGGFLLLILALMTTNASDLIPTKAATKIAAKVVSK